MAGVLTTKVEPDAGFELTVVYLDPLRAAICGVGEFDIRASDALADVLQQQQDARRRFVRLDLSEVTLLDCSCLGVLVASHHRFLGLQGLLVLTGVDAEVARILKITSLDDNLFVVPTDQDPFGDVVMARAARRRILKQRMAATLTGVDLLTEVADELEPRGRHLPRRHSKQPVDRAAASSMVHATIASPKAAS